MALSFRLCTEADMEIVGPILVAAYNFPVSRLALLQQYWALQPDGWWLASLDGEPVGFGGAVDYGLFSYIGMICVHPTVQHRGIGEALVHQILAWGEERSCPTMLLNAVDQAVSLYQRIGFTEETTVLAFRQTEPLVLPHPSSSPLHILQRADIPELVAFDTPYFGAKRAKIFTSFLAANPERAFVSRAEEGQLTGYIFVGLGGLGPWAARTEDAAEQLLLQALSLPFKRTPSVTIPAFNTDGQRLLSRYGFCLQSTDHSMRRGAPVPFRQLGKLYGEASPALG